jgi:hypothetical protein
MITTNDGRLLDYLIAFLCVFLIDGSAGFGLSTLDLFGSGGWGLDIEMRKLSKDDDDKPA